jgi:hypothetical protein
MAGDTSPSRRAQQPDSAAPSSTSSEPAGAAPAASSNGVPPRRDPGLRLGGFTQLKHDLPDSDDEQDGDGPWRTPVGPVTPSIAETAQQLRRSLSVHGLHELAQNPKQLRSKIWRPDDEQARIPTDAERTLVHSVSEACGALGSLGAHELHAAAGRHAGLDLRIRLPWHSHAPAGARQGVPQQVSEERAQSEGGPCTQALYGAVSARRAMCAGALSHQLSLLGDADDQS